MDYLKRLDKSNLKKKYTQILENVEYYVKYFDLKYKFKNIYIKYDDESSMINLQKSLLFKQNELNNIEKYNKKLKSIVTTLFNY